MSDNFKPDSSIKKFLKEISSSALIKIINGIFGTNYPLTSQVFFENTEHFTILGTEDKSSVRGDLTMKLSESEIIKNHSNEQNKETTDKIVVEVQSTKDHTMGFRMFVYSFNATELKEQENKDVYVFPKGATIYTTLDLPTKGVDEVYMQIENFRVGDTKYSAENGDLLRVEFPFVNILPMTLEELEDTDIEMLKILTSYKYKKNKNLIKNSEEFSNTAHGIVEYVENFKGRDRIVMGAVVTDLFADIYEVAKKNEIEYGKVVEIMEVVERSMSQIVREKGREEGREEGIYAMIRVLLDLGIGKELLFDKVKEEFSLTIEKVSEYYQLYLEQEN